MKVIFEITRAQFGHTKLDMVAASVNDFYTKPNNNGTRRITESDVEGFSPEFMRRVEMIHFESFLFNKFDEVEQFTQYGTTYITITSRLGYSVDHAASTYRYCTSGGNRWGVYAREGRYYAWYAGARSRVRDMPCYQQMVESHAVPVVYVTNAPRDMRWYETQASYLTRDLEVAVKYFATLRGPSTGWSISEQDAYHYWFAKEGDAFTAAIAKQQFGGNVKQAEYIFLRKTRNRRVDTARFDGAMQHAWELLPADTLSRILKWGAR